MDVCHGHHLCVGGGPEDLTVHQGRCCAIGACHFALTLEVAAAAYALLREGSGRLQIWTGGYGAAEDAAGALWL